MKTDNEFIKKYEKIVKNVAWRYMAAVRAERNCASIEPADIEQEGYMGLLTAAERYDESRGVAFEKYAAGWIKKYIMDYLRNYGHIIRIPQHCGQELIYTERLDKIVKIEDDEPLTYEDILTETKSTDSQVIMDEEHDFVHKKLSQLSMRQQQVIRMHYGLDGKEKSLQEISEILGIRADTVRETKKIALAKLRKKALR